MTHPGGRPPKYTDPEEMQRIIDIYFQCCKLNRGDPDVKDEVMADMSDEDKAVAFHVECRHPTVSGIAYALNMSTEAFRNYEEKGEFLATVKNAKQRIERYLENHLYGTSVTGSIFNLKNNFGWKDKTEQALTGADGGAIQTKTLTVVGVEPDTDPE